MLIVIDAVEMGSEGFEKVLAVSEIEGQIETIPTMAWSRSAKILRRVRETRRDLLSLRLH